MRRLVTNLLGGRLQSVLIISYELVVAITVILGSVIISRLISDYLKDAQDRRVARDMDLAAAFYQLKLDETAAISHRLVLDSFVVNNLAAAAEGQPEALGILDQQITNKISVLALGGTHFIAVLDKEGNIVTGRVLSPDGILSPIIVGGNWSALPIVRDTLESGRDHAATEIIPKEHLIQVGLDEQARIELIDTPKAAPKPFDPREGSAGLALAGVSPLRDEKGELIGAVVAAYMFNNDYTLVDRIKQVAGIDTVTIFLGDERVSTNVLTEEGERAIGTRISQEVYDVVLEQGKDYKGEAFVVNDWYITRYKPLYDHKARVVGSLYVGAKQSTFQALVDEYYGRVIIIAIISILLTLVVAVPISRWIVRPVINLVDANRKLAEGDMDIRVQAEGKGELAELGRSFNSMVETLQHTQTELLQKEKLASIGQLAAGVAHEINNPLGTILLFSDMLYKETPEGDPRRDDLRMIIDETARAKTIVADLLNFARQQSVTFQDTDLHVLLDDVIECVKHQPAFEKVTIIRAYNHELPYIQADPDQLQQVFINLMNNAAEAMEKGGAITLSTRPVDGQWVEVKVADTGNGIPEENLGRLFTPFFTTKPPGKGTGLGLSIVYGIIKMHRGQITVDSKIGKGTTFTVTLPTRLPQGQLTPMDLKAELIG